MQCRRGSPDKATCDSKSAAHHNRENGCRHGVCYRIETNNVRIGSRSEKHFVASAAEQFEDVDPHSSRGRILALAPKLFRWKLDQ